MLGTTGRRADVTGLDVAGLTRAHGTHLAIADVGFRVADEADGVAVTRFPVGAVVSPGRSRPLYRRLTVADNITLPFPSIK